MRKWGDCRSDRLGLHDLIVSERSDHEYHVEVCTLCGDFKGYRLVDGKMDNEKYHEDHLRDFCQPYGSTSTLFRELHGYEGVDLAIAHLEGKEKAKQLKSEFVPVAQDVLKTLKKTTVSYKAR